jgi:hypothetical protein
MLEFSGIRIYEKLLNSSELTHAPCAPGTLETLARFSILSRFQARQNREARQRFQSARGAWRMSQLAAVEQFFIGLIACGSPKRSVSMKNCSTAAS